MAKRTPGPYTREYRWNKDGTCVKRITDNGKTAGWRRDRSMDFTTPRGDVDRNDKPRETDT